MRNIAATSTRSSSVSPDIAANDMKKSRTRSCWEEDKHGEIVSANACETDFKHSNGSDVGGSNSRLVKTEVKLQSVKLGVSDEEKPHVGYVSNPDAIHNCCKRNSSERRTVMNIIYSVFKSKRFESEKLERLYQRYFFRLNQKFINWIIFLIFILLSVLLGTRFGFENRQHKKPYYLKGLFFPLICIVYLLILIVINRSKATQRHLTISSYSMIGLFCCVVTVDFIFRPVRSAADGVWSCVFFIYLTYTLLPVRTRLAVVGGCAFAMIHLICCLTTKLKHDDSLWRLVSHNLRRDRLN